MVDLLIQDAPDLDAAICRAKVMIPDEPGSRYKISTSEFRLDIDVTPKPDEAAWLLTDLLGRSMGHIAEEPEGEFRIHPAGQAIRTMEATKRGPFKTLDEALAEIERFTRGTCRRVLNDEQPDGEAAS